MQKGFIDEILIQVVVIVLIFVASIGIVISGVIPVYNENQCRKKHSMEYCLNERGGSNLSSSQCIQGYVVLTKSGQQLIGTDGKPVACL